MIPDYSSATVPHQFAALLARQAGVMLYEKFNLHGTRAELKADRSVVTEADLSADRLIAETIHKIYPEDLLISEELSPISSASNQVVWVVDPLDGTTNFSLGIPFWGVSIARLVDGWPETAALYFPMVDEMYTAQRGQGAFVNEEQIQIASQNKNKTAAFFACCSRTHRRYEVRVPYKARILGSAAYNLCAVARGAAILGFEATPKIWDIAAGWLLIEEAGGVIETLDESTPFPLLPGTDYRLFDFPTLMAATRELADKGRNQIKPRTKT